MANSFTVNTYSPKDVSISFGGYPLAGWDSITISRNAPSFVTVRGIRGKHTRIPSGDTSATITVSILQTSPSNDVLSEVHALDLQYGTGRLALTLKDSSGKSVFSSDEGYIVAYPEVVFSGGFEYRSWTIYCQTTKSYVVGGNTYPQTTIFNSALDAINSATSNIF